MAIDQKQKKQLMIIAVALVGFALYEMHDIKARRLKALLKKTEITEGAVKNEKGAAPANATAAKPVAGAKAPNSVSPTSAKPGDSSNAVMGNKLLTSEEKAVNFKRQEELSSKGWGHDIFFPDPISELVEEKPPELGKTAATTPVVNSTPSPGTETALKLTGISKIGPKYYATINRKMLHEGESVSGFLVKSIRNEGVTLQKNQRNYELRLGK